MNLFFIIKILAILGFCEFLLKWKMKERNEFKEMKCVCVKKDFMQKGKKSWNVEMH